MRKFVFSAVLAIFWNFSWAQFGHEWINPVSSYYKITTAKDGIYRITYADLQQAGFPVNSVDPRGFQIYHRGVEQAIYVEGQLDGVFNVSDYIEFYGLRNDGTLDKDLYQPSSLQPHSYYNLYNDTTAYFLTYGQLSLGKRMVAFNEINVTNIPAEPYHFDEKLLILKESYSGGYVENSYLQNSSFGEGEGWTGVLIRDGQFHDYTFSNLTNGSTSGGFPEIEILLMGAGTMPHRVDIYVGASSSSLRLLTTEDFNGFSTHKIEQLLEWSDIGSGGQLTVRIQTVGLSGASDRVYTSYIKVKHAQQYSAPVSEEKFYNLRINGSGKSYIQVSNYPAGALVLDVTDPANVVRIRTLQNATLGAVIPNTSTPRKILLSNKFYKPPVKKVSFRNINPSQAEFVVITNRYFMKPALGYSNVVKDYAGYRSSIDGGGYDTLVVDVDMLYNQFNYGEPSPRAIRKFMEYLINTKTPKYLFLIGKGIDINYDYFRNPAANGIYKSYVPTAGYPASDALYTAGLAGTTYEEAVPTGRITATDPVQVAAYLNKVKEMEARPYDVLWRKRLLHLSGGIRTNEPKLFKSYMEDFQAIAEDDHLGGKVKAIAKETTDVELVNVSDEVNNGLNLVTFYGHSSPGTIDFDIGFVTDPALGYNNKGKYPMFLINGCNAGSFFLNRTLFGEDWINAEDKGAIGFVAHSFYGLAFTLKRYSDFFYSVGYGDSVFIQKGIGDIQKEVARQYMETAPATVAHVSQVQQMILLGDPAVRLFGAKKPDYAIDKTLLSIESLDGDPVTALSDAFSITIKVDNYGRTEEDSLHIRVTRRLSDNSVVVYDSLFAPVLYSDTVNFIVNNEGTGEGGTNLFTIQIDPNNLLPELTKENNSATIEFLIPLNRTKNLYPYDFAIVNSTMVDLRFQTTDQFSGMREFIIEVDTLHTFDSQFKKEYTVSGNVLALQPITVLSLDTLVYYWRTKLANPLPGESDEWTLSSFTFINNGPEGWAQVHFPQYLKNNAEGLILNTSTRKLGFEETETAVSIHNYGSLNGANNLAVSVKINGAEYQLPFTVVTQRVPCRSNTINLIAFDKVTTTPYRVVPIDFSDPRTCGKEPQVIGSYRQNELEASGGLIEYIDGVVPGDSVILFSILNPSYSLWSAAVKSKLGELGISSAQINSLQDGEPIVIFARKGSAPGTAIVHTSSLNPAPQQELIVNGTITGRYSFGNMMSVLIGPAQQWQQVVKQVVEKEDNDEARVDIIGVKLDGEETLLMSDIVNNMDISSVNSEEFPLLKLNYYTADDLNLTPAQLKKWLVEFTPVPEGMIFYKGTKEPVSLIEGDSWSGTYGFANISDKSFSDSLLVRMRVVSKSTANVEIVNKKIKAPLPGDTTFFEFVVSTKDKGGINDINVTVNPRIVPELYYDNNALELSDYLNVISDVFVPVLEVTIDGRSILDGDLVSPTPEINLRLWDDNRYILKDDTVGVTLLMQYPCDTDDCEYVPVYFSNSKVTWSPATTTSDFSVTYLPDQLAEGTYRLRVQAADSRGNQSKNPYEVSFVVNQEETVLFKAPYPNPSATGFTFRLLISGSNAPEFLRLHILSIEGKLVKEIIQENSLFVGTNEIYWDGTNDVGVAIPGGVYLYQLKVWQEGEVIKLDLPANGSFYKAGYGKIVLIR